MPEAIVVVLAEAPYAESAGDLADLDWPSSRSLPLRQVQTWREQEVPVITVLMSGRPLWINPEMNQSDAFVAAWLPGTEAQGIADVLISDANGDPTYEFVGKLPFAWPGGAVNARNADQAVEAGYSPRGYGLTYEDQTDIAALTENPRNEKDGLISPSEGDTGGAAGGDLPDELLGSQERRHRASMGSRHWRI